MSKLYQLLDAPHYDYELYSLPEVPDEIFRGPAPDLSRPFVACVGGAQTFGRFTTSPFPQQLAQRLHMPVLNLGLGGAGPRYALRPEILAVLNRAQLVIVQYFSGRSASCSLFDNSMQGRNSGKYLPNNKFMSYEQFFKDMVAREDPQLLARIVAETREDYVHSMREVAAKLQPPKIALWMSRRKPDYEKGWVEKHGWMNLFPQLLDRKVVTDSAAAFDDYVECVSKEGVPQRLWQAEAAIEGARLHSDGFLYNDYYPTPQLHDHTANLLEPACCGILKRSGMLQRSGIMRSN